MQEVRWEELSDRAEYYHNYYKAHLTERKEKHATTYRNYESYVKLIEAKKILTRHKKEIGELAYDLLMKELCVLQRVRLHGEVCVDSDD